jgi:CheY-like chemotaxis protein
MWPEGDAMNTSPLTLTKTARGPAQKVVVVDGTPDVLELLESVLDGGRYDLLFADASRLAYSLIAKEQPNLVVLCTSIDRADGFQLLSMLKLDPQTRQIPVVTYTLDGEDEDEDTDSFIEESLETVDTRPLTLH